MNYADVLARVTEVNKLLPAGAFHPSRHVIVTTDEGYLAVYPNALAAREGDWIIILAEHHEPKVFHVNDVTWLMVTMSESGPNSLPALADVTPRPKKARKK